MRLLHCARFLILVSINAVLIDPVFSQVQQSEYFWSMPFRESPYQQTKGINPMSASEAQTINHYRLDYDQSQRLTQITFGIGNKLKDPSHHWYTEPSFIHAPMTKIFWQSNQEERQYFDVTGSRIQVGKVWRSVYRYDTAGNRISLHYYDREGKPVDNEVGIHRYAWNSHADTSVVERRYNTLDEPQVTRERFEYLTVKLNFNQQERLTLIQHFAEDEQTLLPDSAGAAQNSFTHDRNGNFIEWRVLDEKGKTVIGTTGVAYENQFYDDRGWLSYALFYDAEGKPIPLPWGPYSRKQLYDKHGNNVRDIFLDQDGKRTSSTFGVGEIVSTWDETGTRLLEVSYLDINRNPVNFKGRGYARKSYQYHANGTLKEELWYDESNRIVPKEN